MRPGSGWPARTSPSRAGAPDRTLTGGLATASSFDRQLEERHVAAALAEEVGILVGLSAEPRDTLPDGRRVSDVLSRLLHLVGRSRALEERIGEVVAEAYASGESWKDIAEVLGMSEEEASETYG